LAQPVREFALYGKFGEAVQVTDGEWVLHQWPPGRDNGPLFWYGADLPAFLRPRGIGPFDPIRCGYAVDWERGPQATVLLDSTEERDRMPARPAEAERLQSALRDWLRLIGAPAEQAERLGL
jgi:hypothetical protein